MTKKYASFMNCGSYKCRMTPFFETVEEVGNWLTDDIDNCYIRPVINWQEVIDNRNSYNCDPAVPAGS